MSEAKVDQVELEELKNEPSSESVLSQQNLNVVKGVKVELKVVLGDTELSVGELFDLKENSVLKLNQTTNEPVELRLDDQLVARGMLVAVDDNFGVQISEVVKG